MSPAKIAEARDREILKHETAAKIRTLLDEARAAYGEGTWEVEGVEGVILEIVSSDDPE